ncbi:hypothetical protein K431DRAFT_127747 [Polychaeton citri CBS 116435]|uniref:Uncharacterized protein n=1 Tax=Polychaeton citri CBS 116435 TaxID=1314669 RepID=A0A9P4Q5H5_9PEZI|nr:hypothetical protein K431DRAFT_127747 [Polychaeton citri CBS 116435]
MVHGSYFGVYLAWSLGVIDFLALWISRPSGKNMCIVQWPFHESHHRLTPRISTLIFPMSSCAAPLSCI